MKCLYDAAYRPINLSEYLYRFFQNPVIFAY